MTRCRVLCSEAVQRYCERAKTQQTHIKILFIKESDVYLNNMFIINEDVLALAGQRSQIEAATVNIYAKIGKKNQKTKT